MLTDFQNSFTGRLSGKFAINWYLNIPLHLKRVATLPCEISMLKNDRAPEETEAHSHVRFSHSKISSSNSFCPLYTSYFTYLASSASLRTNV